ncbi:ABC transporter substrate-binding protein [Campylobacter pinnipediorum subsp. pinnipediorum]|uniref:ABC transporter substrate-binding protein n=1 Tax=Campylobacter pinnipediorum subsp. pinnipediorum TaxID=1660067 RepID=A0AAX0LA92_9BACT|nr:cysteine ABC transporter substrate-binding protein [Campylobacter pinnipediorum]AQW84560.1 amino acid ABC transporter, periplasmic cysteine-binding protein [Campylobacter pinnipediorum subsp. pinnipediorum]OPA77276.1 ABC transporter substrate-binding protein [Campylobacter pinnipediorum subsp. pinnipediorum]
MKKIISFLTLVATIFLIGCGDNTTTQKDSITQIKERGFIRIGVFSDKPPFGFVDSNGKNQGYDIYLAKRIAKDLLGDENKIKFELVEAASRVEFLVADKVDVILANFTVTPERKEMVDFALPYMKVALGVVSPSGDVVNDISQLKDKKLIVNKGTTADAYFTKNHPEIKLIKFDQNTETFAALLDGRGAALAHDNTLLFAWAKENQGFNIGIQTLGDQDYIAPAVNKGNKVLLDWINNEIIKLEEENFFHKAYDETLKNIYSDDIKPEAVVVESDKI